MLATSLAKKASTVSPCKEVIKAYISACLNLQIEALFKKGQSAILILLQQALGRGLADRLEREREERAEDKVIVAAAPIIAAATTEEEGEGRRKRKKRRRILL